MVNGQWSMVYSQRSNTIPANLHNLLPFELEMKRQPMLARIILLVLSFPAIIACQPAASVVQVIPQPLSVKTTEGFFTLKADTKIYTPKGDDQWATAADYWRLTIAPSTGYNLASETFSQTIAEPQGNAIYFLPDNKITNAEGYLLEVKPDAILIRARTAAGAFLCR